MFILYSLSDVVVTTSNTSSLPFSGSAVDRIFLTLFTNVG